MVSRANASHIGSDLSIADILAVLYRGILRFNPEIPNCPDRDRFVMSKGHASAALYAVLAHCGFFPVDQLSLFCGDGSPFAGHVSHVDIPGIELSTGSLGHGLSVACGMALAGQSKAAPWRTYVLLSDGELNEGSNWEAIMFAAHRSLGNLTAIVDFNGIQSFGRVDEILKLAPLGEKWRSWGWRVTEVDGHDHKALHDAIIGDEMSNSPSVVIANTIKGKGVGFMEGRLEWHYRSPDRQQLSQALIELGETT